MLRSGARHIALFVLLPVVLFGCGELDDIRDVAEKLGQDDPMSGGPILDNPDALAGVGLTLAGVTPASDYSRSGAVELSLLELQQTGMHVEVENDDGSFSPCEERSGDRHPGSSTNAISLLLDGSGSMEFTYPPEEYGDLCRTCPHDPNRERIGAARTFVDTVFVEAPDSRMALGEFGPEPTPGLKGTLLHHDFTRNGSELTGSLDDVMGWEPIGTPLYDSLTEVVVMTDDEALLLEAETSRDIPRYLVVLSDGKDTLSEWNDADDVIEAAVRHDVVIYVVGLGPASATATDPHLRHEDRVDAVRNLQRVAHETGGFYASVDDPVRLHELFDTVAAALAEGYETRRHRCVPAASADTMEREPPASGTLVNGRVRLDGARVPWSFVAP